MSCYFFFSIFAYYVSVETLAYIIDSFGDVPHWYMGVLQTNVSYLIVVVNDYTNIKVDRWCLPKRPEFNCEPLFSKFRVSEPFKKSILNAEPSISFQPLQLQYLFLIFALDGLWDHLSNQEAVDIVRRNPRNVRFL
jgi:serine/threonine protein phosphatase PrpC